MSKVSPDLRILQALASDQGTIAKRGEEFARGGLLKPILPVRNLWLYRAIASAEPSKPKIGQETKRPRKKGRQAGRQSGGDYN